MFLAPLNGYVLVEPDPAETMRGGLYIPDPSQERPQIGTVVHPGDGEFTTQGAYQEPPVSEKDRVVFHKYSGVEVNVGGKSHLLIKQNELLAVIYDEDNKEFPDENC